MPKLIFLDIDGTLIPFGGSIHPDVAETLAAVRANGHKVFICTGRAAAAIPPAIKAIPFDGIVASAGSDIWLNGENLYRSAMSDEDLAYACSVLDEFENIYLMEGFERQFLSPCGQKLWNDPVSRESLQPVLRDFLTQLESTGVLGTMDELHRDHTPIPKIVFFLRGSGLDEHLHQTLGKRFYLSIFEGFDSNFTNGEVMSPTDTKGSAIQFLADRLSVPMEDTIAFGDSMNDYPMILTAGYSVAMGNAVAELKECADAVCESVWDNGVVKELQRLGLC